MKKIILNCVKFICCYALLNTVALNSFGQAKSTELLPNSTDMTAISSPTILNQRAAAPAGGCVYGDCICVQGSLDFANVTYSSSGSSSSDKSRLGFNLGVFITHPLPTSMTTGGLLLKGGLEFIQKGSSYSDGSGDKETLTLGYLEIPIDILYEYRLADCSGIFGGLGPYLAYGLGGKDKYTYSGQSVSTNSFSDSAAKRFDFGLHLTAGYRMSCKWSASVAYELGLANIDNSASGSNYSAKNHVWSFNFAYCLGDMMMGSKKK
jgi:Outer membrane protein beta-barrel domain